MTYTPSVTPVVLGTAAGLGAGALLPATGANLNALAVAAVAGLTVWTIFYFVIRKKLV